MPIHSARLGVALALGAAALLGPAPALACTMDMPLRHRVERTRAGWTALADPEEGRVIRFGPSGPARVLTASRELRHHEMAFTHDGASLILARADWSDEMRAAGCMATYVHVERVDLATGARTPIRRLRSAGAVFVEVSPDDRYAIVSAFDFDWVEPILHVFDLTTGARLRTTRASSAAFIDAETLLVGTDEGETSVVRIADGWVLGRLEPDADVTRALVPTPGATSHAFTIVEREQDRSRLVAITRRGTRLSSRPARWTIPGVIVDGDAERVLARTDRDYRVLDRRTGRLRARVHGARPYSTARLAPDGELAVVSYRAVPEDDLATSSTDPSAFQPTRIEVFAADGTRRAWGIAGASRFTRPSSRR